MEKVKVINIKTKVVKEINENLVNDYLGTGEYKIFKEIITNNNKDNNNVNKHKF